MEQKYIIREATKEDAEYLINFASAMAKETENKDLNRDLLTSGVTKCLENPKYGKYLVAVKENDGQPVGTLMITFEMSPTLGGLIYWI